MTKKTTGVVTRPLRNCSTCAAYAPDDDDGGHMTCWNLVSIVIHHVDADGKPLTIKRQPEPDDHCDDHQTHAEDHAENVAIAHYWQRMGLESRDG